MTALRRAQWLDRELGDPSDALGALLQVQLHRYYVPRALGGEFRSFEEVGALVRVVARRDLAVAITHAISLLGMAVVWLAGDASQQRALAGSVLDGEQVSIALTEPASGSDLLATTAAARASGDGYHLTGEKWLSNGLGRHRFMVVYARTAERGGARGFSIFLVDKEAISGGLRSSGTLPTLGLRGADLNGLRFDAQLPRTALIGPEGSGFEVILKALQIARTVCGVLSLGALDASLEAVLRFALQHEVFGERVADLPQSQKLLVEAWAELLVCDSLTSLGLRGLHAVPAQASVHSAVVKYLVPTLAEQAMQKLSVVYGARAYLPHSEPPGIFEKMYRDNRVVSMFDGGMPANLFSLSHQLRALVTRTQAAEAPAWMHDASEPPELDWTRFSLSASGEDDVLASFESGAQALRAWMQRHAADEACPSLEALLVRLARERTELFDAVRRLSPGAFAAGDPGGAELARRYCVVVAAAAMLASWQLNHAAQASTLAHPAVMAVVLHRLAAQLGDAPSLPPPCYRDGFAALVARHERDGRCGLYLLPTEDTSTLS